MWCVVCYVLFVMCHPERIEGPRANHEVPRYARNDKR